jgi:hypothetical protein
MPPRDLLAVGAGRGEKLRRPGRRPPAAEVADALAGRSQIAVALGDLSASSRAALSRTLKAVKAVVGNEITELDFMSEASCIIGMIVRRAESAICAPRTAMAPCELSPSVTAADPA